MFSIRYELKGLCFRRETETFPVGFRMRAMDRSAYWQTRISSTRRDPSQGFTGSFSRKQDCVSEEEVSRMEISVLMKMVTLVSSQNVSANPFRDETRSRYTTSLQHCCKSRLLDEIRFC